MAQAKVVIGVYSSVVNDVIDGVREAFLDDGMDEQILQELKQLWESKLIQSKAMDLTVENEIPSVTVGGQRSHVATSLAQQIKRQPSPSMTPHHLALTAAHAQHQPTKVQQGGQVFNLTSAHQMSGSTSSQSQTIAIPVPSSGQSSFQHHVANLGYLVPNHQGQLGQFVIQTANGPQIIQSQRGLPPGAILTVASNSAGAAQALVTKPIGQPVVQLDGLNDSSSDEDEDDEEEEEEQTEENDDTKGEEEDPLNSDDDISDTDPTEVFDAENVVVCQFDKINRSKNKWKFHLKDGIMNLGGKDHVFQKAHGDAEW